jgi:AraC family transcriptional regulator, regulatory protein of adaptative response / DNA-3-methyladenine glycosylase II
MESYAAVVTTGIYCRPECGARPRPDHVLRFPLAASAEAAGYRACLRCRPYRSPQPATAGPEFVCRAVRLILDGALDGDRETTLSARLGVSARHLRRLFTDHLGVTPDGLARSARTHFARRLLDDTDLPIVEVAFAAGFGSLRQFNRSCLAVFQMTPTQLRARRRRADRLAADGGLVLRLPYRGTLDWDAMLGLLAERATAGVEHVTDRTYRRTIIVGGHPGVLELSAGGHDHLLLRLHLPRWEELVHIVGRARRLASLDLDLEAAIQQLAGDPTLGPLVARRPGLRPPGTWDPFETGVRAIIDRHAPAGTGHRLAVRIVQRFGEPVPGLRQLGLTHTFPTPTALDGAALEDLGLTPVQTAGVRAFCQAVSSDGLPLDRSLPLHRLLACLTAIDGIDEQTAHYIALRLGEADAYPAGPPGCDFQAGDPGRWSPWRALAATHLWLRPDP